MIADHTLTINDGVADVTFDIVAHVEDGDYDWSAEAVLQRCTDGALFYAEDSGCSCYSFGEGITTADLKPIRKFSDALSMTGDRERLQKSYEQGKIEWR